MSDKVKTKLRVVLLEAAIKAVIAYLIRRDGVDMIEEEHRDKAQYDLIEAWKTLNAN